ncbi:MAG: hypothetical protein WBM83_14800 [Flavobacteriaceae bacterium]
MKSNIFMYATLADLTAFALLTLFLSSSVIFDWFGIRAKEGNYVPFVVWTNFIVSWLYLLAAYGFIKLKKWAHKILVAAALILIIALIGLFFHIQNGGLYETKTIGALFFRTSLTLVFALLAYLRIVKK